MKIVKIINNNVVSAMDEENREVVLMGRGLGFMTKEGQRIPEDKIEKVFRMDSQNSFDRFKELLQAMPEEHFQVSSEIIDYAKNTLGKRLNQNIYITLTDHINFTVERQELGMTLPNLLLWEVKKFYPSEYLIGEYAVALIERRLGVFMGEDEAASVALHIVNAEYNTAMSEVLHLTTLIKDILDVVKTFVGNDLDEESLHYSRFITHLKFLAQRVITKRYLDSNDVKFTEFVTSMYPNEYVYSQQIAKFIKEKYEYHIETEELLYLTVHIKRIRKSTE